MASAGRHDGRPQLSDEAAGYVRELVMSGQLRPGEFIRLDRLASQLSMSVTPVRQGLVTLRGEGFVQLEPRRGFVVSDLSEEDILDLFSVQAFVAGEVATHAAQDITVEQITRLKDILASIDAVTHSKSMGDVEALAHEFHEVVIEAAGRPKLAWLLHISGRYEPRRFYSDFEGWERLLVREHRAILKTLTQHDSDGARDAMRGHVEHLGELVARNFSVASRRIRTTADDPPTRRMKKTG